MFINYAQQQRKHCNVQSRTDSQSNRPSARAEGTIVVRIRIVDLFLFKLHTPGVEVVPLLWYVLRTRPNVTSRSCTPPAFNGRLGSGKRRNSSRSASSSDHADVGARGPPSYNVVRDAFVFGEHTHHMCPPHGCQPQLCCRAAIPIPAHTYTHTYALQRELPIVINKFV